MQRHLKFLALILAMILLVILIAKETGNEINFSSCNTEDETEQVENIDLSKKQIIF